MRLQKLCKYLLLCGAISPLIFGSSLKNWCLRQSASQCFPSILIHMASWYENICRTTGHYAWNPRVTGWFPAQRESNSPHYWYNLNLGYLWMITSGFIYIDKTMGSNFPSMRWFHHRFSKTASEVKHGWVIISHIKQQIWLLIHAQISVNRCS